MVIPVLIAGAATRPNFPISGKTLGDLVSAFCPRPKALATAGLPNIARVPAM